VVYKLYFLKIKLNLIEYNLNSGHGEYLNGVMYK